jgi:hypothetical protein
MQYCLIHGLCYSLCFIVIGEFDDDGPGWDRYVHGALSFLFVFLFPSVYQYSPANRVFLHCLIITLCF